MSGGRSLLCDGEQTALPTSNVQHAESRMLSRPTNIFPVINCLPSQDSAEFFSGHPPPFAPPLVQCYVRDCRAVTPRSQSRVVWPI